MPGNEFEDRLHNFFEQDNLSRDQNHSLVGDGSWPVLSNNLWVGNQRQIGVPSTDSKIYNLQQPDIDRGNINHPLHVPHGLSFTQPTLRPEFARRQSQSQQPNLNGYTYGRQVFQTKQDEENFLGVDAKSDRHNLTSRGLSTYESQQGSRTEHHMHTSFSPETSESPVSFDFFGGQQQISGQQPGILQSLPQQRSGLEEEVAFRKMQELQRQQQLRQLDVRQQDTINQIPSGRLVPGNHSNAFTNGTPISDASTYPWAPEIVAGNTNLLRHASPSLQGSSNGLFYSSEQGQAPHLMGLVPQQADQCLYGVPVSGSRGSLNQYSHVTTEKPSMQQFSGFSNSFPGNKYTVFPDQVSMQDGTSITRQGFQPKKLFVRASGEGLNSGMNMENLQQANSQQRNAPVQEFRGGQELAGPSETLQGKTATQVSSSQNKVALDPSEEKFLFGSDDNIWDAFGKNTNPSGDTFNLLDGIGFLNGFPSVQSGSWSALMQSAVAETSSIDIGLREEWTGPSSQNAEVPANYHPSTYNDCGKEQIALTDSNLQIASAPSSGSVPLSDNTNVNKNYQSVLGFQQFGQKFSYEHGERLQSNSSKARIQQSSEGGSIWFNRGPLQKPLAEGSRDFGKASHSLDEDINAKSILGPWIPRQSGSSQPCNTRNSWNVVKSGSPSGGAALSNHENHNSFQHSQSNYHKRATNEERGQRSGIWKVNSVPYSTGELEPVKSMESPVVNREGSILYDAAALQNSSTTRVCEETNQLLPNNHDLNSWKHVDSLVKYKGSESMGKSQNHLNRGSQGLELLNNSDKEEVKMPELENCNRKENSSDSYHSNLSHHSSAGGLRENVLLDVSDSRTLPSQKQKSANQVGRKTSGHKFQYHPMGNMDEEVEPSYGTRQATHSQAMSQQNSRGLKSQDQGYFGQSKFFCPVPKNSIEMEKVQLPDRQREATVFDDASSRCTLPTYVPNTSTHFDSPVSINAPNKTSQSSQNMLELFHKVDQSREHGTMMRLSSSEHSPTSEMPEADNFGGSSSHLQQSQFSASQGFGLQLGPPSQRLPVQIRPLSSQSSAQTVSASSSTHVFSDIRDKAQMSFQHLPPSHEASQGEFRSNRYGIPGQTGGEASLNKMSGNSRSVSNFAFPYSRSQLQNQHMTVASGKVSTNQSIDISVARHAPFSKQPDDSCKALTPSTVKSLPNGAANNSNDNLVSSGDTSRRTSANHPHERVLGPQQGVFSKMLPNAWTRVPEQNLLGSQACKVPSIFSQFHQSDIVESASSASLNLEDQELKKGGNVPPECSASSVKLQGIPCEEEQQTEGLHKKVSSGNIDTDQKTHESQGEESVIKHLSNVSPANPASSHGQIEAFGRSLKPNNFFHQNYSLPNQMHPMNSGEADSSDRGLKRLKGSDSSPSGPQVVPKAVHSNECNTTVEDALVRHSTIPSGDSKMLSFSGPAGNFERNSSSQIGNIPSKDMLNDPQNYSHSNSTASIRVENSMISPQMAPSWFDQHGTFKNGQMLPMYDARKGATMKTLEQQFILGKSSSGLHTINSMEQVNTAADTSQVDNIQQNSNPSSLAIEHFSSPQSLHPDVSADGQHPVVVRPKKRKSATAELHSWYKEVSQGSRSLQTISMAKADWAKAANRLPEKVEDEVEMFEDGVPMLRSKRRLVLTTQLMQQLFHPPPAAILSADVSSNYASVAYFVTRLALLNGCSSIFSCSGGDLDVQTEGTNFLSDKHKTSGRIGDQHVSKVMEDFLARAGKLENDFLRLDKRASISDLRLECQDLEKFSVINRFAKFHSRGQADGAETSSSFDAAANAQKLCLQRYVTALPMPRNLPDRVQCLPL